MATLLTILVWFSLAGTRVESEWPLSRLRD
jgi:hypothetical protein